MGQERRRIEIENAQRLALVERTLGDVREHLTFDADGCPKCGLPKTAFQWRYCFGAQLLQPELPCRIGGEHLHKQCNCGFVWTERCKDWKPEAAIES